MREREENKCGSHYLKKLQIKIFSVFIHRNSGLRAKQTCLLQLDDLYVLKKQIEESDFDFF